MTGFRHFLTKADLFLIAVSLIAGLILTVTVFLPQSDKNGILEVRQNGTLLMTLPLDSPTTRTIEDSEYKNQFTIENGTVTMVDANCHDQTCVRTRGIRSTGQSIVCLPHRLVLTIVAEDASDPSLDAVVQ